MKAIGMRGLAGKQMFKPALKALPTLCPPHTDTLPHPDGLKQHGVGVALNPPQSKCMLSGTDGLT